MIDTSVRGSAGWWLAQLAARLTVESARVERLNAYLTGNAPLPEGAEGFRDAYRAFQRKARTNFAELVVEAVQERMTPAGFNVPDGDYDPDSVWSQNELDVVSSDIHHDMLAFGKGYAIVGPPDDGVRVVTREDPRTIVTAHHPLRPSIVTAALKMWRDDVAGTDHAYVYLPGVVYSAIRDSNGGVLGSDISGFKWDKEARLRGGEMPVVCFSNAGGTGEFETHIDVLDRINYMILQRLVITAMQAFRQRAVIGDLPETDESGNPIDYGSVFRPGPGALWLTGPDVQMWESSQTSIQELLNAVKDDIRELSAGTRTPVAMLMPDGANQSAEGASFNREGLIFKTQDRMKRATYGWNKVMSLALGLPNSRGVQTLWLPPERLSLAERADAAAKLVNILPWQTIATSVLQYSPAEAERMEVERMNDVLTALLGADEQGGEVA